MKQTVLHLLFIFDRHDLPTPSLENDAVDYHIALRAASAQHREFLWLHKVFNDLAAAAALVAAATLSETTCRRFTHPAIVVHLASAPDGVSRPVVRRRVTVGVENLGL